MPVLELNKVTIEAPDKTLVRDVSFSIDKGEWFALVGESGGGKSLTASSVGRLLPDNLSVTSGEINLLGKNMLAVPKKDMRHIRGRRLAYVFQDYQSAFTPFIRVGKQMDEMIRSHETMGKSDRRDLIIQGLTDVGLDAERAFKSYPFQLSGGQLQRAAIAQAMLLRPALLVADEPTTALDSISTVVVLKLLRSIKERFQCAILFITHDLRCVRCYADSVAIINKGEIVEAGSKDEIVSNPKNEYTRNLFASIPPLRDVPGRLPCTMVFSGDQDWRKKN